jgi:hypothetical protein
MFQLTEKEEIFLRSQNVTSKEGGRGGRRYPTTAFTELGIAMLSSVLSSEQAIQSNIRIMRLFFELILNRLDQLEMNVPLLPPNRKRIGI